MATCCHGNQDNTRCRTTVVARQHSLQANTSGLVAAVTIVLQANTSGPNDQTGEPQHGHPWVGWLIPYKIFTIKGAAGLPSYRRAAEPPPGRRAATESPPGRRITCSGVCGIHGLRGAFSLASVFDKCRKFRRCDISFK